MLALADVSANFTDPNVGRGKVVNVAGISVGGLDAGNYSLQNTSAISIATIVSTSLENNPSLVPQLPPFTPVLPTTTRTPSSLALSFPAGGAPDAAGTAPANAAITVALVRAASDGANGMVAVSIPKDMISKGESFSFALPAPVAQALAVGGASARVTRMDTSPLPAWLKYVAESHTFDVSAAPAGVLPFEVLIVVDGQRWTLVLAQGADK